jgi:hypothetical protein
VRGLQKDKASGRRQTVLNAASVSDQCILRRQIDVYLPTDTGSKLVGTLSALDDGPLHAALAMSGIRCVNLRWDVDQILAIEVQSLEDVDKLKALGFEPAGQLSVAD